MLGVFLDRDTLDLGDIDFSGLDGGLSDWHHYHYPATAPGQVLERIAEASVVITNKVV